MIFAIINHILKLFYILSIKKVILKLCLCGDDVAECLRRWTANPLGNARVGSNPIFVDLLLLFNNQTFVKYDFCYY